MKEKDENIIDYGTFTVPTKWEDLDLATYSDIERYYTQEDKKFDIREVLHIFTHKTVDEINQLPAEFLEILLEKLAFLQTKPTIAEPSNKVIVDGEEYMINVFEKMKTGEYVASDTILKGDKHDYASLLAVLCRKKGELFDSKFEAEVFEKRREMWGKQPVVKILPIVNFFLQLWYVQGMNSQLYSQVEEAVNHIQQNIDNSPKIGAFRRLYLNWRMKKLRKLLKSNKNTSRTSSSISRTLSRKAKWRKRKINFKKIAGVR